MNLLEVERYRAAGLSPEAIRKLGRFGDLLLGSPVNVTSVREEQSVERYHFLDCLSLLEVECFREAGQIVDVGSGGGLPAVVLALALPGAKVVALESVGKKCTFVANVAHDLELPNLVVECGRAEDLGRGAGRESFDVVVARAVAIMPVLAELCLPLVRVGGSFVAMKGNMSNQERMEGDQAVAILGGRSAIVKPVVPYAGAENLNLVIVHKQQRTHPAYPRRVGVPSRRPLGGISAERASEAQPTGKKRPSR
jgi:16S rRNA (guanine527-N7)-methyltransferase